MITIYHPIHWTFGQVETWMNARYPNTRWSMCPTDVGGTPTIACIIF
jgi:hypothetical protein